MQIEIKNSIKLSKNKLISVGIFKHVFKKSIVVIGFLQLKKNMERDNIIVKLAEKGYKPKYVFKELKIRKIRVLTNMFILKIPIQDVLDMPINNNFQVFCEQEGYEATARIMKFSLNKFGKRYNNSNIRKIEEKNTSIYIRQTVSNNMVLTVRKCNKTDGKLEQLKLNLAKLVSNFYLSKNILMYEKDSGKYEESASVVYEKLIDEGYSNVYFIIDKNSAYRKNIKPQYMKNIIWKYTFKHYVLFFKAKSLISSESPGHSLELRTANKHTVRRIYSNKFRYVFLQHGVMYMVSLNAGGRGFFRKGNQMPQDSKIVVSSEKEAEHFIELGGYSKEDLYITGLAKFDRSVRNDNADKIVIMPTWRSWEYNQIRADFKSTGYYKMIKNIISGIDKKLKKHIIVLPHPLIKEFLIESEFAKYIDNQHTYDEILKQTKVLITDYSSISYDAFYRGANVIFWWGDKEECMEEYKGHLMLNLENVFGDVVYNTQDVKKVINNNYVEEQKQECIEKYSKIVEFKDGKNTERIIKRMKEDKII